MIMLPWFWRAELVFVLFVLLAGIFLVKLTGNVVVPALFCLSVYLLRHLFYINRLLSWLRFGKANRLPAGDGVWEDIYYLVFRIRKRNRRRKKLLLKMLERFRTSTAALPDATVVLGSRDEIEWFNEAAERLLGIRRGDIGQNIGNLLRSPRFTQHLRQGDYLNTVSILSPVTDRIQLDVRIVPYGHDLRLLVAQDVTQLRFMERVRSDFIANVSHELRTPLTVLRGYVETLNDAGDRMPANYQQMFARMEEQTSRMQNLVEGLLSLTRLESVSPGVHDPVDVPAMLESICADARLLDEQGPALKLILDTPDGLLGSDPELHSAFSNLIFNAVKYNPSAGRSHGKLVQGWRRKDQTGCQRHRPRHRCRTPAPSDRTLLPGRSGNGETPHGLGSRPGHRQTRPLAAWQRTRHRQYPGSGKLLQLRLRPQPHQSGRYRGMRGSGFI